MDWLDRYATDLHQWRSTRHGGRLVHYRPLGLVEMSFDADGLYYEGRADISLRWNLEVKTSEPDEQLRERIVLALTCLRLHHTMLASTANAFDSSYMDSAAYTKWDRYFLIHQPNDMNDAIRSSEAITTFVADHLPVVDTDSFDKHVTNSSRVVTPETSCTRLFVLPMTKASPSTHNLRLVFVLAHLIADGMATRRWQARFLQLLNTPLAELRASIPSLIQSFSTRLVLPQESHYPLIAGSQARRRWFWAITLVLRHVRRPPPPSFPNPLYRPTPTPPSLPPTSAFSPILPYTSPPSLNAGVIVASIPPGPTSKLLSLCRASSSSLGAGLFVLVALSMMEFHSLRDPSDQRPFVGSFPINPRPLFPVPVTPDSCMLAFSSGVVLPFLPPSLPLAPRIRLLVRSAQRQLSRYQKRAPALGAKERKTAAAGPAMVLPLNYLDALERVDAKLPPRHRMGLAPGGPDLRPQPWTLATCGVSSVGRADGSVRRGMYDLAAGDGFAADFRSSGTAVRPRDGEFLVGIGGTPEGGIGISVSYDACAVDEERAERWRRRIEEMLDEVSDDEAEGEAGRARL